MPLATAEAAGNFPVGTYTVKGSLRDVANKVMDAETDVKVRAVNARGTVLAECAVSAPTAEGNNFALMVPLSTAATDSTAAVGDELNIVFVNEKGVSVAAQPIKARAANAVDGVSFTYLDMTTVTSKDGSKSVQIPTVYLDEMQAYLDGLPQEEGGGKKYDPWGDYDGDGFSNYNEYLAGTSPFDASDVLRIRMFEPGADGHRVTFEYVGGHLYGVPLEPPASPAEPVGAPAALPAETLVQVLAPLFASPSLVKTGHNTKYDRELLSRFGMPVAAPCHDTMLMHFALDAADRHGLDRLARICLGYDTIPISTLIGEGRAADPAKMAELPPAAILDYAAEDADVALRLYDALLPEVEAAGLSRALEISEEPLVDVLLGMEEAGVRIDAVTLRDFGRELETEIAALEARIYEAAGGHFNLSSPRQLGDVLFGKLAIDEKAAHTATGQYVTSEDVLQKYAAKHPIVADILDWRAAEKLKSTYADKLPVCISAADGRVHTHFSQAFTETGRLASSDPNLQNIPVRTERGKRIRAAVVARDDNHVLVSADYSQIELRIMAALSGDEAMLEAFRSGRDIHTETASRVFKVAPGAVTPEQRSRCKMVNFGIIYGISVFGLGQRLGISRTEAGAFIDEYFIQYPGVRSFMEKAVADAREKGYAETVLGRRRSLRDISSRNGTVRQAAERNAINTPVQGSAADLIKMAMVRVDRALRAERLRARLVLQIHDELLLDVPKDEEPRVREIVREAMLGAWDFGVPLEVEIGSGRTWLDAH